MKKKTKGTPSASVGKHIQSFASITVEINGAVYIFTNKSIPDSVCCAVEEHIEKELLFSSWIIVTECSSGAVLETHSFYAPGILSGFNFVEDPIKFLMDLALTSISEEDTKET